jgi:hypothetical protein
VGVEQVFISYARIDIELARALVTKLSESVRPRWDAELAELTGPFQDHLHHVLIESLAVIVIVTDNSAKSEEVAKEVEFALSNRKPVIPLFAGKVKPDGKLLWTVGRMQRVFTKPREIEDRAVEEIVVKLRRIEYDGLRFSLDALEFGETDIPRFGSAANALERACNEYFAAAARQGNFIEAFQLVAEMRTYRIAGSEAVAGWVCVVNWYHQLKDGDFTWTEFIGKLAGSAPSEISSPDRLAALCPEVAQRVNAIFWRKTQECLEIFCRRLEQGQFRAAARALSPLESTVLKPVARIAELAHLVAQPNRRNILECAERVVSAYETPQSGAEIALDAVLNAAWPPDEQAIKQLTRQPQKNKDELDCLRDFERLLESFQAKCRTAGEVLQMLRRARVFEPSEGLTVEPEDLLQAARGWQAGLEKLGSSSLEAARLRSAAELLEKAGKVFRAASRQADCVQQLALAICAYQAGGEAALNSGRWLESLRPLEAVVDALERLYREISEPPANAGNRWMAKLREAIEERRRSLVLRRRLYSALESAQHRDYSAARFALQRLTELRQEAEEWLTVCRLLVELEDALAALPAESGEHTGAESLLTHAREMETVRARLNELKQRFQSVRMRDPMLKAFELPQMAEWGHRIEGLEAEREIAVERLARNAVSAMEQGHYTAASELLAQAEAIAPASWVARVRALTALCGSAGHASSLLDDLRPQLEELMEVRARLLSDLSGSGEENSRVEEMLEAAERLDAALRAAEAVGFPVGLKIPGLDVIAYASCVRKVLRMVDREDWPGAESVLTQFIFEEPAPPQGAWDLLSALKRGSHPPLLLEDWLCAPVSAKPRNRAALLCALGEVERVMQELRTYPSMPHNAGVAVLCAMRHRPAALAADSIEPALGVAALFACCPRYREAVARKLGHALPSPWTKTDRSVRDAATATLKALFEASGLAWGRRHDAGSWASRWDVECFAVTQMNSGSWTPLAWPFGPSLIRMYELESDLESVLARISAQRCWYGPCAAGAAMNLAGDPEAALRALPKGEELGPETAVASMGYRKTRDPLAILRRDVNRIRTDALFAVLNREQLGTQATAEAAAGWQNNVIQHVSELLRLREAGLPIEEELVISLRRLFSNMVEQLRQPMVHLGRAATDADADVRKSSMQTVLEFLEALPRREWLDPAILALRSFLCDVLRETIELKEETWRNSGKPAWLHRELCALAEEAVRNDPQDGFACLAKAEVLLLENQTRQRGIEYLAELQSNAANNLWNSEVVKQIRALARSVEENEWGVTSGAYRKGGST